MKTTVEIPDTDVLIAACARQHGARLEHAAGDFDLIDTTPASYGF